MELLLAGGLGLLAFVEPCSIGIHLVLVGYLERLPAAQRLVELAKVALVRATVLGLVGLAAAWIGSEFFTAQGTLYLTGRQGALLRALTPSSDRLERRGQTWGIGVAFGLYVPACAIPLLLVLVGAGAAQSAAGAAVTSGFISLFVFGLALSAPLFALVGTARGQHWIDRLVRIGGRLPHPTGALLVVLGFSPWALPYSATRLRCPPDSMT